MKAHAVVIFVSDKTWRVGVISGEDVSFLDAASPEGAVATEQAQALNQCALKHSIAPGEVILGVPSAWCMSASLEFEGAADMDRKSLLFELEEQLPIVAEQVSADFLRGGGKALGVCIERARLSGVVDALEAQGWSVSAVCPAALLALSQWLNSAAEVETVDAVLAQEGEQWTLLPVKNGVPTGWFLLPAEDIEDLRIRLEIPPGGAAQQPLRLLVIDVSPAAHDLLTRLDDVELIFREEASLDDAATRAAGAVLSGRRQIPINLDLPGHRSLSSTRAQRAHVFAAAGCLLFLAALAVTFFVASWRMDRQSAILQDEQFRLFRQVAHDPHRQPPRQVYRYLASELQRMTAADDSSSRGQHAAMALRMLSDVFARLPDHVPMQLERIVAETDRAELAGRVTSHEDAGKLASSLGSDGALIIQPPQTSLGASKSVDFILQVQRAGALHPGASKEQP
jgi:hypothetical protein